MDSYQYLNNQAESQFPSEKREQLVDAYLAKKAMIKDESVALCEWCKNQYLEKNSRQKVKLCKGCENGRGVITRYMESHKLSHLSDSDILNIKNSKTTRLTSGRSFNK